MKESKKDILLAKIRNGTPVTRTQQFHLAALLSVPAIMVQLSSIIMQYIDASMVGQLGANDSASIGLVAASLWLFSGICNAATAGFSVQVAQLIGAKKNKEAKDVFRQSITCILIFSATLSAIGMAISGHLPVWLRGSEEIRESASTYFLLFSACIPLLALEMLAASMLRCTGNIKIPSLLNILMCVLDMIFNYLFIFPTHDVTLFGMVITIPGAELRVQGAAIGTIIAVTITSACMMYYACFKSKDLQLNTVKGSFKPTRLCINKALRIGCPMALVHVLGTNLYHSDCSATGKHSTCSQLVCGDGREYLLHAWLWYCRRCHHARWSKHRCITQKVGEAVRHHHRYDGRNHHGHYGRAPLYVRTANDGHTHACA